MYAKELGLNPRGSKMTLRDFNYNSNTIMLLHWKEHFGRGTEEGIRTSEWGVLDQTRQKKVQGVNLDTDVWLDMRGTEERNLDHGIDDGGKGQQRRKESTLILR